MFFLSILSLRLSDPSIFVGVNFHIFWLFQPRLFEQLREPVGILGESGLDPALLQIFQGGPDCPAVGHAAGQKIGARERQPWLFRRAQIKDRLTPSCGKLHPGLGLSEAECIAGGLPSMPKEEPQQGLWRRR